MQFYNLSIPDCVNFFFLIYTFILKEGEEKKAAPILGVP